MFPVRFIGLFCSVFLLLCDSNGANVESSKTRNKNGHLVEEIRVLIDLDGADPNNSKLFDENDVSSGDENENFPLLPTWNLIPKLGLPRGHRIKKVLNLDEPFIVESPSEASKVLSRRKRFLSPNILLGRKFLSRHHNFAIEKESLGETLVKRKQVPHAEPDAAISPSNINEIGYEELRKFHSLVLSTVFSLCPRLDYFDTMRDRMNEIVDEKLKAAAQSRLIPLSSSKRDYAALNKRLKKCESGIVLELTTQKPKVIEPKNRTTNRYEYYRKLARIDEEEEERNARFRQFDVVPSPLNILRFQVVAAQLVARKCGKKDTDGNEAFTDFLVIFADLMKSGKLNGIKTKAVTLHQTEMLDMIEMLKQCTADFQTNKTKLSFKL